MAKRKKSKSKSKRTKRSRRSGSSSTSNNITLSKGELLLSAAAARVIERKVDIGSMDLPIVGEVQNTAIVGGVVGFTDVVDVPEWVRATGVILVGTAGGDVIADKMGTGMSIGGSERPAATTPGEAAAAGAQAPNAPPGWTPEPKPSGGNLPANGSGTPAGGSAGGGNAGNLTGGQVVDLVGGIVGAVGDIAGAVGSMNSSSQGYGA